MMQITLPMPPSANAYYRSVRGRVVKSEEARAYQLEAGWTAKIEGFQPVTGDITVSLDVYRPRKSGDLDNCLKVLLDSLNGIAWFDDGQITAIHARRFDDKENPRVEVTVDWG